MNKLFIAGLLVIGCTSASADTLYNGAYGGVSIAYVDGDDSGREFDDGELDDYTSKTEPDGEAFGLLLGYNWTLADNFIVGLEADYAFSGADDKSLFDDEGVPDEDYPVAVELENSLSIRGRIGRLFNDNKTLAYVTGGYASAKLKRRYYDEELYQSSTDRQHGWTAGVGVEHNFYQNLSFQAEYRYTDYRDVTISTAEIYGDGYTQKQSYDEKLLRVGIIYHF